MHVYAVKYISKDGNTEYGYAVSPTQYSPGTVIPHIHRDCDILIEFETTKEKASEGMRS